MDVISGQPRGFSRQPWIPTARETSIVSSSVGLLLLQELEGCFTVVNPLTKEMKKLPALDMSAGKEIVYSGIQCSRTASSYKVFTMGRVYKINMVMPENESVSMPVISEYKQPFMHVYCSETGSWTSITSFPREFVLPRHTRASSQSRCSTASPTSPTSDRPLRHRQNGVDPDSGGHPGVPGALDLHDRQQRRADDRSGRQGHEGCDRAGQAGDQQEIPVPSHILPTNELLVGLMEVWGFSDSLFLHIPVQESNAWSLENWDRGKNIAGEEPTMHCWFFSLYNSVCCDASTKPRLPVGAFISGAADSLKLVYSPSFRLP